MYKLIIDTSGIYTLIGILNEDNDIISQSSYRIQPLTHLHQHMQTMLTTFDLTFQSLSLIAVIVGPGSWTGLNIGVVAAKTLARTLDIPLLPLSSFEVLALSQRVTNGTLQIAIDARQKRIYNASYPTGEDGFAKFGEGTFDTVKLKDLHQQLEDNPPDVLVTYRQSMSRKKDVLQDLPQLSTHQHHHMLPFQAMVDLLVKTESQVLTGENILNLMPDYMQLTTPERQLLEKSQDT